MRQNKPTWYMYNVDFLRVYPLYQLYLWLIMRHEYISNGGKMSHVFYKGCNWWLWFISIQASVPSHCLHSRTLIKVFVSWLGFVYFMVFNATFSNISVISWRSALLVEEAGVPGENHHPAASHWQNLSYDVVLSTPHHERNSNSQH